MNIKTLDRVQHNYSRLLEKLCYCTMAGIPKLFRLTEHFGFKKKFAEQNLKKFFKR